MRVCGINYKQRRWQISGRWWKHTQQHSGCVLSHMFATHPATNGNETNCCTPTTHTHTDARRALSFSSIRWLYTRKRHRQCRNNGRGKMVQPQQAIQKSLSRRVHFSVSIPTASLGPDSRHTRMNMGHSVAASAFAPGKGYYYLYLSPSSCVLLSNVRERSATGIIRGQPFNWWFFGVARYNPFLAGHWWRGQNENEMLPFCFCFYSAHTYLKMNKN